MAAISKSNSADEFVYVTTEDVCQEWSYNVQGERTVRIVGVTKAQQTLQNLFGWNPIIISMSSQNRCSPAPQIQEESQRAFRF